MALSTGRKVAVGIGVLIALIVAVGGLVLAVNAHDAAQKQAGRDEVQAKWNDEKAARAKAVADFQVALGGALQPKFDALAAKVDGINATASRINVELPRAIADDPRYRDPNCNLTQPVIDNVNRARGLSGDAK